MDRREGEPKLGEAGACDELSAERREEKLNDLRCLGVVGVTGRSSVSPISEEGAMEPASAVDGGAGEMGCAGRSTSGSAAGGLKRSSTETNSIGWKSGARPSL